MAENASGRNSCIAVLNVLVPKAYKAPEFIEDLRALLTEQGTVSLECKVVGVPTPFLRWFKDSKEIKAGNLMCGPIGCVPTRCVVTENVTQKRIAFVRR